MTPSLEAAAGGSGAGTPPGALVADVHFVWGAGGAAAARWNTPEGLREGLRRRGIGMALVASDLARRLDPLAGNEEVAALVAADPSLRAWLVAHPDRPQDAIAQMRRLLYRDDFVGCALYPDLAGGRLVTLRGAFDILNAFRRFAKPLLIETPNAAAVAHAAEIAQEMGTMRVIAAGMGGAQWREAVDLSAHITNLYLDVSGVLDAEKITYAARALHGVRKLVFGSGAPLTDPAAVIGMLDDIDLSPEDRARILGLNANRLFNLLPEEDPHATELAPLRGGGPSGDADGEADDEETPHLETLYDDDEDEADAAA